MIPNEKHGLGRSRAGKSGGDPKLTLTLTLSVTIGLGLELTPGETISVENQKPNGKDQYRRRRSGKDL